jgi:hypothetical protein
MLALLKFLAQAAQFAHHLRVLGKLFHNADVTPGTVLMVSLPIIAVLVAAVILMARADKRASESVVEAT